jgi:aminoglycoside phosphotransferase (APT) family kinase protein
VTNRVEELATALAGFLDGAVTDLRRLSGGASRETFSFDLDGSPMIMQRVRPGPVAGNFSMDTEAALLREAAARGVPVAGVVAFTDDRSVADSPFIVVHRLPGETIPRRIQRDAEYEQARRALVSEGGAALALIHSIEPQAVPGLKVEQQVESLRALYDMLSPELGVHPAFELAFRWLERYEPAQEQPGVVHGDFRLGNLLVDGSGLRAVLDWELSHLGDRLEDLAWFSIRAWRFGGSAEVAGLGTMDELIEAYEGAGGAPVDRDALRWWQAACTLRWGVICMLQTHTHLSAASRSVELATIGRRVCETEYDLLRLVR